MSQKYLGGICEGRITELAIKDEYFKDRTVLVGVLRNKEQLEINLKGKFYHTKCSNVNLAEHNIKFVALSQSKKQFVGVLA